MYNIACGYAMLNDNDNALAWLQRSLDNGFEQTELLASDSDLDPIRTDARFKKLLATVPHGELYVRSEKGYGKFDRLEQANYDYARLERESSQDGDDWAKVGARMVMLRDFDRAVIALNKAVEYLAERGENAMYNLACAYSLKGDREAGIKWLEKSVNAGFDGKDNLKYDPDLNNCAQTLVFRASKNCTTHFRFRSFSITAITAMEINRISHTTQSNAGLRPSNCIKRS